jgi:hypothetical protein
MLVSERACALLRYVLSSNRGVPQSLHFLRRNGKIVIIKKNAIENPVST